MFDKIKKAVLGNTKPAPTKAKTAKTKKSEKDLATEAGEPWVGVLGMELMEGNLDQGAFELDWNDIFVAKLIRSGYQGKTGAAETGSNPYSSALICTGEGWVAS